MITTVSWLRVNLAVALMAILLGCVYVGQAWSPSSYGHVLQNSGATDTGVIWGEPRLFRSDEWSVTTPLIQAAVRNGFERFNQTSYYKEDLRSNYALPLNDWALVFKPGFWLFNWVPPEYAFSWHYWLMSVAFVFGYAHLFRMAGAANLHSFVFSLGVYFTGFVQFFWNSNTTLLALFPWLLVVMGSSGRLVAKVLIFYWVATSWLIGNFYPPLFISLALVGGVFLWAFRPDLLKSRLLAIYVAASLAACGTAVFYLWDYLVQTAATSYPGQRVSVAGYYPWHLFMTHFWPSVLFDHDFKASVSYTNVTGVGVVGLYWTLAALCFANWTAVGVRRLMTDRAFKILLFGLAISMAWMLTPVPAWVGRWTLLERVPPERMVFAAGLLLFLCVMRVFLQLGMAPKRWGIRFGIYFCWVIGGWLFYGRLTHPLSNQWDHLTEFWGLGCVGLALWAAWRWRWNGATALLLACTLANVLVLGRFNPIQSAIPLFQEPQHLLAQTLRAHVNADGVLAVQKEGFIGATLNGMGFKAVAHLNVTPQWSVWERSLGGVDASAHQIFNRYAHIRLITSESPVLLENDQVGVPVSVFRPQPSVSLSLQMPRTSLTQGVIERVQRTERSVVLTGWADWSGFDVERELKVVFLSKANVNVRLSVVDQERWDRVGLLGRPDPLLSGFVLTIHDPDHEVQIENLCVYSRAVAADSWVSLSSPWTSNRCLGDVNAN